jgi:hypothetical protein
MGSLRARRGRGGKEPAAAWDEVVAANDATPTQWRIPMARLSDTQLIILSAASQRDNRGVELPANVKGEAARKVVDKLLRARELPDGTASQSGPSHHNRLEILAFAASTTEILKSRSCCHFHGRDAAQWLQTNRGNGDS